MATNSHGPPIRVPETQEPHRSPETTTVTLNFSILYQIVAGFCALLLISTSVLLIVLAILNGSSITDLSALSPFAIGAFSLMFFGTASVAWVWTLKYPAVTIKMNEDGLLIFGYYITAGFSTWDNLVSPEIIRIQGLPYFALRFKDLDAFMKGRTEIIDDKLIRKQDRFGRRVMRIVIALLGILPKKFVDLFFSLFGFAGAPKSAAARDMLDWTFESFGYHLVIPYMLIRGGPRSLVQKVEEARRAYTTGG
jgi:hypothetical protein